MENNFDIELLDEQIEETSSVQLPLNFLTFGEIDPDDVRVYIKQDVYKALEKMSASDTTKELGSIIIGDYCEELGKTHVIISEYIEAKYTDASASTLTFTHETWNHVHTEHERLYSDKKIMGWQHTHPNYGIFLSNYDMFIQENFFNLPFQVAYVIDPIQNLRGFFQWKNGKIEKLKGYYIYDEIGKPIKIEQMIAKKKDSSSAKPSALSSVVITLLCIFTVFLSLFAFSLNEKYEKQLENQQMILDEIEMQKNALTSQSAIISDQARTITELQERQFGTNSPVISGQRTATELIAMIENGDLIFENKDKAINELKTFASSKKAKTDDVYFITYVVEPGDSLHSICNSNDLAYDASKRIILAINGIENADELFVGQTLLLPAPN